MENNKLKPCPFCGEEAHVVWDLADRCCFVICDKCSCRTPNAHYKRRSNFVKGGLGYRNFKTDDEAKAWAVKVWNNRKG